MIGAWRRVRAISTRLLRLASAAALVAASTSLAARPAWAAGTVAPESVSLLSDPGVALVAPADGRLRGDHLTATVTGEAFVARIGHGASARPAARGQRLVVFGLQGARLGQTSDSHSNPIPRVTGTFIVDGQRSPLPVPDGDDGSAAVYYLASFASGAHDVDVELAASGLAQTFSLTAGARVGVQPVVLYRDRAAWQPIDQISGEQEIATPDPANQLPGATLPIRVHDVYLSWFGPDSAADVPPSADRAWLVVDATSQDDSQIGSHYLHYLSGLADNNVTLTPAGGPTISSQLLNAGSGETGVGVFDGIYDFAVPGNLTGATLTIAPGNLQVTVAYSGSTPVTIAARGQASFPITFPAPYQPPPPVAPAQPDSQQAAVQSPSSGSTGSGGLSPAVPLTAVLVILGAVAGVTLTRRRRQPHPAGAYQTLATPASPYSVGPFNGHNPRIPSPTDAPTPTWAPRPPAPARQPSEATVAEVPDASRLRRTPTPPPTLTPAPSPSPPPPGMVYFEVLGPFRITGWPADQTRSSPIVDLATYLALHPERQYTADELRDPLSIGKPQALEAATIRTYAGTLRRAIGPDHLPDAGRKGYALAEGTTDWHRFLELSTAADPAAGATENAALLAGALALVRGLPFSELPSNGFGWVATELLISQVEVAVIDVAGRLVELALDAGDWPLAAWATERGLAVSPTAQQLNTSALHAAERSRQPDRVAQAWRDVTRRYSAANEPVPDDLKQLHDEVVKRGLSRPVDRPTSAMPPTSK